jgi:hypothetical protein
VRHRGVVETVVPVSASRTLIFAVIAIALGLYIYTVERPMMQAEGEKDRLLELDAGAVKRLRLSYPDSDTIVVEHDDDGWRMIEPMATGADDGAVSRLIEQIAGATAERRIAGEEAHDLDTYGLAGDGERARISITLDDGSDLADIVVGRTTPVGYSAFARVEGSDDVVVTPLIFHTGVKKTVFELRDKRLFDFADDAVTRLEIESPDGRLLLSRDGERWRLEEPLEDRADANQVKTLISSLTNLQALAFYEAEDVAGADAGLDTPGVEVTLEFDGHEPLGFRLGRKIAEAPVGYYMERRPDGQLAKVPEWVGTRFGVEPAALRDKHLFDCSANDVARMRFERSDGDSFDLVLGEEDAWTMDPARDGKIKRGVVTRRRNGLATLAGTDIVAENLSDAGALAQYGLAPPAVTVELQYADGTVCGKALAGAVGEDTDSPSTSTREWTHCPATSWSPPPTSRPPPRLPTG